MNKDKVRYIKDKKQEAIADTNYKKVITNNAENPIVSRFLAFRKTKQETNPKDLL